MGPDWIQSEIFGTVKERGNRKINIEIYKNKCLI